MENVIISVIGKDSVGIIAAICTYLSKNSVNINDISQTIVQEYFNMMMIADISKTDLTLSDLQDGLNEIGLDMGVQIKCQREEIFDMMHRI